MALFAGTGFDTPPAVLYIFQLLSADWLMCMSAFCLMAKHHPERAVTSSKEDEEDSGYDLVEEEEELV
jgi:hypothetical protein